MGGWIQRTRVEGNNTKGVEDQKRGDFTSLAGNYWNVRCVQCASIQRRAESWGAGGKGVWGIRYMERKYKCMY